MQQHPIARVLVDCSVFGASAAGCGVFGVLVMTALMQGGVEMRWVCEYAASAALIGPLAALVVRRALWTSLPRQIAVGVAVGGAWGAFAVIVREANVPLELATLDLVPYAAATGALLAGIAAPVYACALATSGRRGALSAVIVHAFVALVAWSIGGFALYALVMWRS